jgi:sugar phosphate isomerase/epimerase
MTASRREFLFRMTALGYFSAVAGRGAPENPNVDGDGGKVAAGLPGSARPVVGYMVYGYNRLGIVDQISAMRDRGFLGIGFHTEPVLSPLRAFNPFTASLQEVTRLRSVLSGFRKVEVHGPYSDWDISLVSPNPGIRRTSLEELERHIDFAAYIGASVFTTHPGVTSSPVSASEQLKLLEDSMQRLAQIAQTRRLLVCVETSDILLDVSKVYVFDSVKCDFFGMTMDTGHISFHLPGAEPGYAFYGSFEGYIAAQADKIRHVHLNDYNAKRDHLGIGQGQLPLRQVLVALHRGNYRGFFDMEVDPNVAPVEQMPAERDSIQEITNEIWIAGS